MSERKPRVVVVGGGLVSLFLYYMTQFNAFVSMISYSAMVYNWGTMVLDIVKVLKYTYSSFFLKNTVYNYRL